MTASITAPPGARRTPTSSLTRRWPSADIPDRRPEQARGSAGEVVGVHLVDELPELLHYLFGHALAGCPGGRVEDTLLGEHGGAVAHRDGHGVGGAGREPVHVAGPADDDPRDAGGVRSEERRVGNAGCIACQS